MYNKATLLSICSTIGKRETSELRMQNRTAKSVIYQIYSLQMLGHRKLRMCSTKNYERQKQAKNQTLPLIVSIPLHVHLVNTGSRSPTHELSLTVMIPLSTFQCARAPCTRTLLNRLESLNALKQGI